ncbi:MAG: ion transporter [Acidobacteria bacterium]|nr:ion transporter [Acidobacteriota bacterium]
MSTDTPKQEHDASKSRRDALIQERAQLLQRLEDWLETPMLVLAFVWLALLVIELIGGTSTLFDTVGLGIWGIFILNFVLEFTLTPHKLVYLKSNWLTALSLLVPALRVFRLIRVLRVFRMARAARGLRLLRVVSSVNRSMGALSASLNRRGFAYVVALTLLVTIAGAAGMYAFENEIRDGIHSYGEALWWTAMIMTTMGSQYWPQTIEGRVLCVVLALYAFGVFGYVTATLATFFVGRDAQSADAGLAGAQSIAALQVEIAALRDEIRVLTLRNSRDSA